MVRDMIDEEGNVRTEPPDADDTRDPRGGAYDLVEHKAAGGQVVSAHGARGGSTAYVGATHFMAMLDDVRSRFPPFFNRGKRQMLRRCR